MTSLLLLWLALTAQAPTRDAPWRIHSVLVPGPSLAGPVGWSLEQRLRADVEDLIRLRISPAPTALGPLERAFVEACAGELRCLEAVASSFGGLVVIGVQGAIDPPLVTLQVFSRGATPHTELLEFDASNVDQTGRAARESFRRALEALGYRATRLEISVAPSQAELSINGQRSTPGALELPPGEYEVSVRAPGFVPFTETITLAAGTATRLEIDLRSEGRALVWGTLVETTVLNDPENGADVEGRLAAVGVEMMREVSEHFFVRGFAELGLLSTFVKVGSATFGESVAAGLGGGLRTGDSTRSAAVALEARGGVGPLLETVFDRAKLELGFGLSLPFWVRAGAFELDGDLHATVARVHPVADESQGFELFGAASKARFDTRPACFELSAETRGFAGPSTGLAARGWAAELSAGWMTPHVKITASGEVSQLLLGERLELSRFMSAFGVEALGSGERDSCSTPLDRIEQGSPLELDAVPPAGTALRLRLIVGVVDADRHSMLLGVSATAGRFDVGWIEASLVADTENDPPIHQGWFGFVAPL